MNVTVDQFKHESWLSMIGMAIGYGAMLALVLVLFFIVPFLVVWLL